MTRSFRVLLASLSIALLLATAAHAQGKWTKLAPFPEPAEELLGARPCAGKCRRAERQPAEDRTDREDHRRSKRATAPCDATRE